MAINDIGRKHNDIDYKKGIIWDRCDEGRETGHRYIAIYAHEMSRMQEIVLLRLARFGDSLWLRTLDGKDHLWPQYAWADEHHFHQLQALLPCLQHRRPKRVLILGGGDFLAAWRATMVKSVEHAKIADWDPRLSELVLKHQPWVEATGTHKRVEWGEPVDVRKFLPRNQDEQWDVIIGDLTDLTAMNTLVPDFAEHVFRILKPGGVFSTQAGSLSVAPGSTHGLRDGIAALKKAFRVGTKNGGRVEVLWWPIESFSYPQAFVQAWKEQRMLPACPTAQTIWRRCSVTELKSDRPFLNAEIAARAFAVPLEFQRWLGLAS